jgi:hypothetical protein
MVRNGFLSFFRSTKQTEFRRNEISQKMATLPRTDTTKSWKLIFHYFSSLFLILFCLFCILLLSLSILPFIYLDGDLSVPNTPAPRKSPGRKPNQKMHKTYVRKLSTPFLLLFRWSFQIICIPYMYVRPKHDISASCIKLETFVRETEKLLQTIQIFGWNLAKYCKILGGL